MFVAEELLAEARCLGICPGYDACVKVAVLL